MANNMEGTMAKQGQKGEISTNEKKRKKFNNKKKSYHNISFSKLKKKA